MRFVKRPGNEREKLDDKVDKILLRLDEIRQSLADMQERVSLVEKVLGDRLPPDILTERKFIEEVQSGDEIIERIVSKVQELTDANSLKNVLEDKLDEKFGVKPSPVEMRRIERIMRILSQHGKLTSRGLSKLTGLSRTRCNEYFKQMELLGMVEPVETGRQKFYRLS